MEAFALYLLKSVIWLTGFALVYFLFLQEGAILSPEKILSDCRNSYLIYFSAYLLFITRLKLPAPEMNYTGMTSSDPGIVRNGSAD